MIPSDSGSRRAASGGALERRKMARASRSRTAATMRSVLRVRRPMEDLMREASGLSVTRQGWELGAKGTREEGTREKKGERKKEKKKKKKKERGRREKKKKHPPPRAFSRGAPRGRRH